MKITSTEIKNSFGKYLRLCHAEPVYITKNGKTIAKLINHNEKDDIIEESINLSTIYNIQGKHYRDYPPDHLAEASSAYNSSVETMSYEAFMKMNENAESRFEYIDGQVYMLAAPSVIHQRFVSRLHIAFDAYLKGKPCDAFVSPFDVTLLRRGNKQFTNVVQPDLLIVCNWRDELNDKNRYTGTPKLVLEVLSPSTSRKDMLTKLDLYRDSGVEEYWIVDAKNDLVIVYEFRDYNIANSKIFSRNDLCKSFIYEGFEFSMIEEY